MGQAHSSVWACLANGSKHTRYRAPQPLIAMLGKLIPRITQYMQYRQVQIYDI